jgi:hypothetical protein
MAHRHLVAAQQLRRFRAFSSEVDTGSRQENASNKNLEPRFDSIEAEKALGVKRTSTSVRRVMS